MIEAHKYEAGLVRPLDGSKHAIRSGVDGPVAACGAGRIETRLVDSFDESSGTSCLKCMQVLNQAPTPG